MKHPLVGILSILVFPSSLFAAELRIAAWNLEHLNADEREGCVIRTQNDYDIIKNSIDELEFDIVAIQEVKDIEATRRVFPEDEWNVEISKRPPMKATRECWGLPNQYLQHLATGFAIRRGISYQRNPDYKELGLGDEFQRWGTDITILEGQKLRLLSVHLRTGCWGPPQDEDETKTRTCDQLRSQIRELVQWRDARQEEEVAFAILGDFNRNMDIPDDWAWKNLSAGENPLHLLTGGIEAKCDPRYPRLIDHIAANEEAQDLVVEGSTREGPRVGEHPDHCAVYTSIRL
ncbi:MAG: endonuclease/exonuclease/phosphatase [Gammaproteobacteria bacterium]|nr:endonuclease/exonuclease/phosphatase [Gammaproteobacteria bacterium]